MGSKGSASAPYRAGEIVLAGRGGDKPAVVVEDDLFPPEWPNVILVPLTDNENLVVPDLSVRIEPTAMNGLASVCWAASAMVATTPKRHLTHTDRTIRPEQLALVRRQIALVVGAG